jgi:peptidoglycan hydrolase-like protein with peptidoglycan-binding domain
MGLIASTLWPALDKLEPTSQLSGICADKPGYHNTRKRLIAQGRRWKDYSIRWPADLAGPDDECAGIDWTFPEAHKGNYDRIAKYTRRLIDAGKAKDPRRIYMREVYGNADLDNTVEGWDFVRGGPASSDPSHLWHIHISVRRKYVNDKKAIDAILSIIKGESLSVWSQRWSPAKPVLVAKANAAITMPAWTFKPGTSFGVYTKSAPPYYKTVAVWQAKMRQRGWKIEADGKNGPNTGRVILDFQKAKNLPQSGKLDKATYEAAWKP